MTTLIATKALRIITVLSFVLFCHISSTDGYFHTMMSRNKDIFEKQNNTVPKCTPYSAITQFRTTLEPYLNLLDPLLEFHQNNSLQDDVRISTREKYIEKIKSHKFYLPAQVLGALFYSPNLQRGLTIPYNVTTTSDSNSINNSIITPDTNIKTVDIPEFCKMNTTSIKSAITNTKSEEFFANILKFENYLDSNDLFTYNDAIPDQERNNFLFNQTTSWPLPRTYHRTPIYMSKEQELITEQRRKFMKDFIKEVWSTYSSLCSLNLEYDENNSDIYTSGPSNTLDYLAKDKSAGCSGDTMGSGLTLTSILSTLSVAGLKEEFDAAIKMSKSIPYVSATQSRTYDIILHSISGLLSAYQDTGDVVLLQRASELGKLVLASTDPDIRTKITSTKIPETKTFTTGIFPSQYINFSRANLSFRKTPIEKQDHIDDDTDDEKDAHEEQAQEEVEEKQEEEQEEGQEEEEKKQSKSEDGSENENENENLGEKEEEMVEVEQDGKEEEKQEELKEDEEQLKKKEQEEDNQDTSAVSDIPDISVDDRSPSTLTHSTDTTSTFDSENALYSFEGHHGELNHELAELSGILIELNRLFKLTNMAEYQDMGSKLLTELEKLSKNTYLNGLLPMFAAELLIDKDQTIDLTKPPPASKTLQALATSPDDFDGPITVLSLNSQSIQYYYSLLNLWIVGGRVDEKIRAKYASLAQDWVNRMYCVTYKKQNPYNNHDDNGIILSNRSSSPYFFNHNRRFNHTNGMNFIEGDGNVADFLTDNLSYNEYCAFKQVSYSVNGGTATKVESIPANISQEYCLFGGLLALGASSGAVSPTIAQEHLIAAKRIARTCYATYSITDIGLNPSKFSFDHRFQKLNTTQDSEVGGPSFTSLNMHNLHSETIQTLYILYKITGDIMYQDQAYSIAENLYKYTKVTLPIRDDEVKMYESLHGAIKDGETPTITRGFFPIYNVSNLEHKLPFTLSQSPAFVSSTLKYLYLIFDDENLINIDTHIFNFSGHHFKIDDDE